MSQVDSWLTNHSALELFLKDKALTEDKRGDFPSCDDSYFDKYITAKKIFRDSYYNEIEQSANASENDGTVYTKHGIPHVRSLIHIAEKMIINSSDSKTVRINGYESFLLLMSILLHDLGMFYGRKEHEKMCLKIINKHYKEIGITRDEALTIARISESHSGKDSEGNPDDTLSQLSAMQNASDTSVYFREKMLAAILRFADELSDNDSRAYDFVEKSPHVNDYSKICHAYCKAIASVKVSSLDQSISIDYSLSVDSIKKQYKIGNESIYLIDFIMQRIEKMEQERAYCTRHFSDIAYLANIKAHFRVYSLDSFDFETERFTGVMSLGEKQGYPSKSILSEAYPDFTGARLLEAVEAHIGDGSGEVL